jgi:hypothetical protein
MVLMMFASPLQMHLMTALTANPSEHNPCNIGRENLQHVKKKQDWIGHQYSLGCQRDV